MRNNQEYYIYCDLNVSVLPSKQEVETSTVVLQTLQRTMPHLLHTTKRYMPHQKISWLEGLKHGKDYPFHNGRQAETKDGVVWTDYKLYYWPLMLALLKQNSALDYQHVHNKLFNCPELALNWEAFDHLLKGINAYQQLIEMDELDRWYDEISATLINARSYHALYRWLGNDVRQVGYDAFDFFMTERDREVAWHKALAKHLETIKQLSPEMRENLLVTYLQPLIKRV